MTIAGCGPAPKGLKRYPVSSVAPSALAKRTVSGAAAAATADNRARIVPISNAVFIFMDVQQYKR
jgi:hypothetical protein